MPNRPVMLMILDGWGWREESENNAVRLAKTPNFTRLWESSPHAFLKTSGLDVGLPEGQMGNSEVGHLNLGAGRVVMQDLPRINRAIADGSIAAALEATGLIAKLKQSGGACHLLGLVSPGGVHAHQDHAVALAKIVTAQGVPVRVHIFTDGRDTPPQSAGDYVRDFVAALPEGASVASLSGRYYAMDRDNRWERVEKAWAAMVLGEGKGFASAEAAVAGAYAVGINDEFIMPDVIGAYAGMQDGDGLLSFNFRSDRIREILAAVLEPEFSGFKRSRVPALVEAVSMTSYSAELDKRMAVMFAPQTLANGLGETVAKAGLKQVRMAETEKYPHVTYFFNGGEETPYPGEDRVMVPSPKVATYDLQPEMSAAELTDKAVAAISSGKYDLVVLNFANPDMVGHTGVLSAAIKAVETVDGGLGRIAEAVTKAGGALLVTADHGNCELMVDPVTGMPHTAHTTNPVPLMLIGGQAKALADGRLADISPTLLALMGLEQPAEMTGGSLLR
ncbi:2,3-bisphosphoglycerate-independent phosphoglycerate mutase [Bosea caraganae]|uniref:2,3-bisphosphoglycerate-independent phosphoglycerate mutase n=1 Tax=Bosea caraganae TaxID=2763117 RepID=A0A370KYR0_9HYPH|nr:2,3-bisphosphoglycerate-independent phosphoglycerate mutase [Bosea caraganae]RDJ20076.1 2,3-bisphosphoglycerate-independent phosphoglycerate mutase [Bosea caraganae]RDJ25950.1 2,3-bisphosphoglycerate-independent phosphoglycerate mutase [Bosea caraganae]